MRRSIIRSAAITTVLSGTVLAAAGVAAAADQKPTGGDNPSAQSSCGPSDRYSDPGCMLGWAPFFK